MRGRWRSPGAVPGVVGGGAAGAALVRPQPAALERAGGASAVAVVEVASAVRAGVAAEDRGGEHGPFGVVLGDPPVLFGAVGVGLVEQVEQRPGGVADLLDEPPAQVGRLLVEVGDVGEAFGGEDAVAVVRHAVLPGGRGLFVAEVAELLHQVGDGVATGDHRVPPAVGAANAADTSEYVSCAPSLPSAREAWASSA